MKVRVLSWAWLLRERGEEQEVICVAMIELAYVGTLMGTDVLFFFPSCSTLVLSFLCLSFGESRTSKRDSFSSHDRLCMDVCLLGLTRFAIRCVLEGPSVTHLF